MLRSYQLLGQDFQMPVVVDGINGRCAWRGDGNWKLVKARSKTDLPTMRVPICWGLRAGRASCKRRQETKKRKAGINRLPATQFLRPLARWR